LTWATANARGDGTWHYCVVVPGTRYVVGTAEDEPEDAWYVSGGYSYLRGLDAESLRLECQAHPADVWPDTGSMDIEIHDPTGTFSTYLRAIDGAADALLTTSIDDSETTIPVTTSGVFSVGGHAYCGLETMEVRSAPSGTSLLVYRAKLGSTARPHTADADAVIPVEPEVTTGPGDLRGRRVVIYGAEERDGVVSAYTALWRGYVSGWPDRRPYWVSIPVSHVLSGWLRGEAFAEQATGTLRGLYVPNYPGRRWGRLTFRSTTSANVIVDVVASDSADFFASREVFFSAIQSAIGTVTGSWTLTESTDERALFHYSGAGASEVIAVKDASGVAILLGFEPSYPHFDDDKLATYPQAEVFTDLIAPAFVEKRLYLRDGEAAYFATTSVRLEDDTDTEYDDVRVTDVDESNDYLAIEGRYTSGSWGAAWPEEIIVRSGSPAPIVRQTWTLSGEMADVLKTLWCGRVYDGSSSLSYTLPEHWLPCLACEEGDVDWTTLQALTRSCAGGYLSRVHSVVVEPTDTQEIATGWLLACGIYAYLDATGRVTFALAGMPAEGEDLGSDEVTDTLVDQDRASTIRTEHGGENLVNALKLAVPIGYETNGDLKTRPLYIVDGASIQRYGRRRPRSIVALDDDAKEIALGVPISLVESTADFETAIALHLRSTLLGMLSRPRATLRLPVSPVARVYQIGDVVRVTSEWATNPWTGERGLDSVLALITGWTRGLGYGGEDELTLLLAGDGFGVIAPAALATSYTRNTKTVTFADCARYKRTVDTTDLDYVEAGDAVEFRTYNAASPTTWQGVIASVTRAAVNATVVLTTDVFEDAFASSIMAFDLYSECVDGQRSEGWVWLADDGDGQVEDLRVGWRWAT